jgi:hypothetical protein
MTLAAMMAMRRRRSASALRPAGDGGETLTWLMRCPLGIGGRLGQVLCRSNRAR